jgi:hypothetical protein
MKSVLCAWFLTGQITEGNPDTRQRQTQIQHRSAMQFDLHQFPDPSSPPIDEPPAGPDSVPVREPNPIPSPDVPVREPDPAVPNQI